MNRKLRRFISLNKVIKLEESNENRQIGLKIEERAEGDKKYTKLSGYAALFDSETIISTWYGDFREKIAKGAFARAIREKHGVKALRNHDSDKLLGSISGKTLTLEEDDKGLWIEIQLPNTELAKETAELISRGDITGQSFAFVIQNEKWVAGEGEELDLRVITDVDLYDVGPVTYPAYEDTTIDARTNSEELIDGLRSLGREVEEKRSADGVLLHPKMIQSAESRAIDTNDDIKKVVERSVSEAIEQIKTDMDKKYRDDLRKKELQKMQDELSLEVISIKDKLDGK